MKYTRTLVLALFAITTFSISKSTRAADTAADSLAFEVIANGWFAGWGGGPRETQFIDSTTIHGGRYSVRMRRGAGSPSTFTTATRGMTITFSGKTIELRGWLKTHDVQDGFAGLWMRLDGQDQSALQFDNMQNRNITGTHDWTEYRIELPLDPKATTVVFGALIAGTGTLWADDLQLLVDGKPVKEAPPRVHIETSVDKDHEFDDGSKVAITAVSKAQIANLATLARVWGFVKYHHPKVTAGEVSWDYELFRVLPAVLAASDRTGAQQAMVSWLDGLGAPAACTSCAQAPESAHLQAKIGWIRDRKALGEPLATRLEAIYRNRSNTSTQFYVSFVEGVKNPAFANERSYGKWKFPDTGYRLLALFRYWNVIEYWFPYRNLIDETWDGVLVEFIPRFVTAPDELQYKMVFMELVARIDDGHSNLSGFWQIRPPEGDSCLAAVTRYVKGDFIVYAYIDSLLGSESGVQLGDVLTAIDGRTVKSIVKSVRPYYGASNEEARMRTIAFNLTDGSGGPCNVRVTRGGKSITVATRREPIEKLESFRGTHDLPGPTFQKLSDDVAYLKLSSVKEADIASYLEGAAGTQCFIIDIRNYPSEFMPFALGGHLVNKPTPFACFTKGDATNPGTFTWTEPTVIEPLAPHYEGKVIVLVDDASISQSEYTAMAFRAAGATIVGSTTAGADGNVSRIPLPGNLSATMSGIGVFYPDRSATQQLGIVPDHVVYPTPKGIIDGRDEVAEAAVRKVIGKELKIRSR